MPSLYIDDFSQGMDRSRKRHSIPDNACWTIENAHLNRGGEIKRRKAFVDTGSDLTGTHGLACVRGTLFTFAGGDFVGPDPVGLKVQTLEHPDDPSIPMRRVLDTELYNGRVYVVAQFEDNSVSHYYEGVRVSEWDDLVGRYTSLEGVSNVLCKEIDSDRNYSASLNGTTITVTGQPDVAFTFASEMTAAELGAKAISFNTTQAASQALADASAFARFSVQVGPEGAAPNAGALNVLVQYPSTSATINQVYVDGVPLIQNQLIYTTETAEDIAADLRTEINNLTTSPNYIASGSGETLVLTSEDTGEISNDLAFQFNAPGDATLSGGTTAGGIDPINAITGIFVDDVDILDGAAVRYRPGPANTAADIEAAVNAATGATGFTATRSGIELTVFSPAAQGSTYNGKVLSIEKNGTFNHSEPSVFTGGSTNGEKSSQITEIDFTLGGGDFDAEDIWQVFLSAQPFEASLPTSGIGTDAWTYKKKMHSLSGSVLTISDLNDPTSLKGDLGSTQIGLSRDREGTSDLTSVTEYDIYAAIFAEDTCLVYSLDEDPNLNTLIQVVANTGCIAPRSPQPFGGIDVFYLDRSGVRSLRPRDSSGTAKVEDVGTRIEPFVKEHLATLTDAEIERAIGIIEPEDSRYWLILKNRVFVFSFFPRPNKVAGWSYYDLDFDVEDAVVDGGSVHLRSAASHYIYGGATGDVYPTEGSDVVIVETASVAMQQDAKEKSYHGLDFGLVNLWRVHAQTGTKNPWPESRVGDIEGDTYNEGDIDFPGSDETHMAFKLVCDAGGDAEINQIVMHYEQTD